MTFEELETLVANASWFQHLGEPLTGDRLVQITTLMPWANQPTGDEELERIADQMNWLPSARDEDDPIHGRSLEDRAEQLDKGEEYSKRSLDTYKKALAGLRSFGGHPLLEVGPHNFAEAARGAALFASRRAAYEVLLDGGGFWCETLKLYHTGHWPMGILPTEEIVVV